MAIVQAQFTSQSKKISHAKTNKRKTEKGLDKRHFYDKKDTRRLL